MAQRAQILALELIGQAINVDQVAQAHPLISSNPSDSAWASSKRS